MTKNILGKRISELRKKKNITQAELAEKMKMSVSTIAMWEVGKRDPDTEMITKLANFFNVTTDLLLIGKETESMREDNLISEIDEEVRSLARDIQNLDAEKKGLLKDLIKTMQERGKEAKNK